MKTVYAFILKRYYHINPNDSNQEQNHINEMYGIRITEIKARFPFRKCEYYPTHYGTTDVLRIHWHLTCFRVTRKNLKFIVSRNFFLSKQVSCQCITSTYSISMTSSNLNLQTVGNTDGVEVIYERAITSWQQFHVRPTFDSKASNAQRGTDTTYLIGSFR